MNQSVHALNGDISNFQNVMNLFNPGVNTLEDFSEPDTSISTNLEVPITNSAVTFEFVSSIEMSTFECQIDSGEYAPCVSPFVTPELADGSHTINVRAISEEQITDSTPATYEWELDTVIPSATMTLLTENPSASPTRKLQFESDEDPVTFRCEFNNTGLKMCRTPFTTSNWGDGDYILTLVARDPAGNQTIIPDVYTWTQDTSLYDSDGDGAIDVDEDTGPNDGDANDDEISDKDQPNIVGYLNEENKWIALELNEPNCVILSSSLVSESSLESQDQGYDYPGGLIDFVGSCEAPTNLTFVTLYLYDQSIGDGSLVRKYNPNSGTFSQMYTQSGDMTIGGHTVGLGSYTIGDGSPHDTDGDAANGQFSDPIGLAVRVSSASTEDTPAAQSNQASSNSDLAVTGDEFGMYIVVAFVISFVGTLVIFQILHKQGQ